MYAVRSVVLLGLLILSAAACRAPEPVVVRVTATPRVVVVMQTPMPGMSQDSTAIAQTATESALQETRYANQTLVFARATSAALTPSPTPRPSATPTPFPVLSPTFAEILNLPQIGTTYPQPAEHISVENLNRLTELARWGKGVIQDLTYSPDGSFFAVSTSIGVFIFDANTYEELRGIYFDRGIDAIAFSTNGKLLAVGFENSQIQVLELATGAVIQAFNAPDSPWSLTFLDNDRLLYIASEYGSGGYWEVATGQSFDTARSIGITTLPYVSSIDGRYETFVSGPTVRVWDWSENAFVIEFPFSEPFTAFVMHQSSYAIGRFYGGLEVYNRETNDLIWTGDAYCNDCLYTFDYDAHAPDCYFGDFDPRAPDITDLSFSIDGKYLITNYLNQTQFRDLSNGSVVRTIATRAGISFSQDNERLAWESEDGIVHIENVADWSSLTTVVGFSEIVSDLVFSEFDGTIAIKSPGSYRVRSITDGSLFRRHIVENLAYSPDGRSLALGYFDGRIEIRAIDDLALLEELKKDPFPVNYLEYSSPGDFLLARQDCQTYIWDTASWDVHASFEYSIVSLITLTFSPTGEWFYFSTWERTELRDPNNAAVIGSWAKSIDFEEVVFLPDGVHFIYNAEIYDAETGQSVQKIFEGSDWTGRGVVTPDGSLFIVPADRGLIRLYDTATWERLVDIQNSTSISTLAISPDGRLLAVSGYDGVVSIWGIAP